MRSSCFTQPSMSDTPEQNIQADDAQAQAGGTDASAELLNKINCSRPTTRKLLGEKKNALSSMEDLQRQISDLQNNQQKAKQAQLLEREEYKTLWSRSNRHCQLFSRGTWPTWTRPLRSKKSTHAAADQSNSRECFQPDPA